MKANNQITFNFHSGLFEQIYSRESLEAAFKAVKRNNGSAGIDGVSVKEFSGALKRSLTSLSAEIKEWRYKPSPVRRVEIPKGNGKTRKLGIPTVRDRVVHMSIKMALEPLIDPFFSKSSYGFRPGRNQQQAVVQAKTIVKSGKEWVVDIDLSKFFDRIHHDRLIHRLKTYFDDRRVLRLIGIILRSGAMEGGLVKYEDKGSVQGSPLSPLLSNVVLDELDKELEKRGLEFCRFADDMNAFVKSEKAAMRVMASLSRFIEKKMKLVVNKSKSQVSLSKGVKFLGMTIIGGTMAISNGSMSRAMEKVKELTPRGTHLDITKSLEKINQWYRGWSAYYSMTVYPWQLWSIEAHIRRRIRARIVNQQKRRRHLAEKLVKRGVSRNWAFKTAYSNRGTWGMSITSALHYAYDNDWFRREGLFIRSNEDRDHWKSVKRKIKLV